MRTTLSFVAAFCATFCSTSVTPAPPEKRIVCYLATWSTYRPGKGHFETEDIDPYLCTHLLFAFVGVNADGSIKLLDPWNAIGKQAFRRLNDLKLINPELKTLIAIGGWTEGSVTFSEVANSSALRANFIRSATSLVKIYGYDGVDLDWDYPAQRGGGSYDKDNFVTLLKEFRTEFDKHGLLLTAGVAPSPNSADKSYDVPKISAYLDFISVITYDLHGPWTGFTGQNSPMYASSKDKGDAEKSMNVDACIRGWISRGAKPDRLNIGVGAYGRTFTLQDPDKHDVGATIFNVGKQGPYTKEGGMLGYNEIFEKLEGGGWTVAWDDEQKVPYAYRGDQWISYEDPKSVTIKVEYAKSLGLGGAVIWSIDTDDFDGLSGTRYPILNAIKTGFASATKSTVVPPKTVTAPPANVTEALCQSMGFVRDPIKCSKFYYCQPSGSSFVQLSYKCANGLVFDATVNVCNYPSKVQC